MFQEFISCTFRSRPITTAAVVVPGDADVSMRNFKKKSENSIRGLVAKAQSL
jgi:hypothetical protein